MRILAQDFRFAFRRLNNSPRFSVVAVLTLDAGFGTKNGIAESDPRDHLHRPRHL